MPMLAFFPWLTIPEPLTVGRFKLLPWERGTTAYPGVVDEVLGNYVERTRPRRSARAFRPTSASRPCAVRAHPPIESATLLQLGDGDVTSDLNGDDLARVFEFGEFVAFAGLARRSYFSHTTYVNRDTYTLIVQAFSEADPGAVVVVADRRDGTRQIYLPRGTYLSIRPPHVDRAQTELDPAILRALVSAADTAEGVVYDEAIFSFNIVNTDSERSRQQHEIVSLTGAFERLLTAKGNADDLASKLAQLVAPFIPNARCGALRRIVSQERALWTRTDKPLTPSTSITEAWARDLYRVRNAFGHGRKRQDKPTIWPSAFAHLLLGAYLFPLTVLIRLSNEGHYTLSDEDRRRLKAFAYVASVRDPLRARRGHRGYLWIDATKAADDAERYARFVKAWDDIEAKHHESKPES